MTEKDPNLVIVPKPAAEPPPAPNRAEKRRRPRIALSSEQFRLGATGKLFQVLDLSNEGMAFRVIQREDLGILPVQMQVDGILNLRGEKFYVKARVIHLPGNSVGCEFTDLPGPTIEALGKFLDPDVQGKSLKPIPASTGGGGSGGTLWYHGSSGTDLLLHRGLDGQFHRLTLYLLGSYIQWDDHEGMATGRASSSQNRSDFRSEEWGIIQFETMVMTPDASADPQKLGIAKALILSSNLPEDLKQWSLRRFA